jgi:hypothetical protein
MDLGERKIPPVLPISEKLLLNVEPLNEASTKRERSWRTFSASCLKHKEREKLTATPALNAGHTVRYLFGCGV